jgi:hypothetical protein
MFDDILAESATVRRMEPPAEVIRTPLLPHQQEALAWMVDRENNDRLPPFWEIHTPKGKVQLPFTFEMWCAVCAVACCVRCSMLCEMGRLKRVRVFRFPSERKRQRESTHIPTSSPNPTFLELFYLGCYKAKLAQCAQQPFGRHLPPFWEVYTPKGKVQLSLNVLRTTVPLIVSVAIDVKL